MYCCLCNPWPKEEPYLLSQAMHRSEKCREWTKLIIFLGTPHRGSAYASWGQIVSNLARLAFQDSNKTILKTLEVSSEVLDNIHENFKNIVFKGGIKIHSFQEAQGIAGMKGLDKKVWSSATRCIFKPHSFWSNH